MTDRVLLDSLTKWEGIVKRMEGYEGKTNNYSWLACYWTSCSYCERFGYGWFGCGDCPLTKKTNARLKICAGHAYKALSIAQDNIKEALHHAKIVLRFIKKDCKKRGLC